MNITKFGHCCLLVETGNARILTDPGFYNETPPVTGIDTILITHEHRDHCHVDSLKAVLAKNPRAKIITHTGVGAILDAENIPYANIEDGQETIVKDVPIKSFGTEHACIYHDLPKIRNTGFFIDNTLFYPGDSFHNPKQDIPILALPVAGPWMKISEAIDYAKAIKPQVVFPVHDGMLRQEHQLGPTRQVPQTFLEPLGIKYVDMTENTTIDFDIILSENQQKHHPVG